MTKPLSTAEIQTIRRRAEMMRAEVFAAALARLGAWLRRAPLGLRNA